MRVIGVIGGLGPQATMDFESRVHRIAQQMIAPDGNAGYPPMVVYYCRFVPFVATESGAPELPLRPDARLLEVAKGIGGLADFIVITSNFLHAFRAEVEQASGRDVLSMIEVTLADVRRRGWSRVGVLGFGDPLIYTQAMMPMGLASETIEGELRTRVDASIRKVMEGADDAAGSAAAQEAVSELRARGVDGIILGCTEIPLLLGEEASTSDLINPLQLVAEAAVSHALN